MALSGQVETEHEREKDVFRHMHVTFHECSNGTLEIENDSSQCFKIMSNIVKFGRIAAARAQCVKDAASGENFACLTKSSTISGNPDFTVRYKARAPRAAATRVKIIDPGVPQKLLGKSDITVAQSARESFGIQYHVVKKVIPRAKQLHHLHTISGQGNRNRRFACTIGVEQFLDDRGRLQHVKPRMSLLRRQKDAYLDVSPRVREGRLPKTARLNNVLAPSGLVKVCSANTFDGIQVPSESQNTSCNRIEGFGDESQLQKCIRIKQNKDSVVDVLWDLADHARGHGDGVGKRS
ncbi:hypothetical protein BC829DRAFT_430883 [Chytridium lagenaria]|nr:hypothetical protein BC829DRAFT_430883 [Chytridium lagenaria]